MSLLFIDSFDHYDGYDLSHKGYSVTSPTIGVPVAGEGRRAGTSAAGFLGGTLFRKAIKSFTDSDTVVVGCAIKYPSYYSNEMLEILDAGGVSLVKVETTTAGEFKMTSGGVVVLTGAALYTPTVYNYYELKYIKGTGSNAVAELRKDGAVILNISTSTETSQASAVQLPRTHSAGSHSYVDDLYILNGIGATNNDYLGDVRVDAHIADADGVENDFVGSAAGANYLLVDDEPTPDEDATFVENGNIGDRDLYECQDATLGTVIYGVQPLALTKKTDAGIVTAELISEKPGGAGEKSTVINQVGDNYAYEHAILELDPDDDTTWTDAKVNATEFGYKINNITT